MLNPFEVWIAYLHTIFQTTSYICALQYLKALSIDMTTIALPGT